MAAPTQPGEKGLLPGRFHRKLLPGDSGLNVVRLTAVGLAVLLAGCFQTDVPDSSTQHSAFVALYQLDLPDLQQEGVLELRLDGPTTIADRDLELRGAYTLQVRAKAWPAGAHGSLADAQPVVHHLDGRLLLVRSDCPGGVPNDLLQCGNVPVISWLVQGAPAPFGVGWSRVLDYQVDGSWVTADTAQGKERGLPLEGILPNSTHLDARLRFVPTKQGIPERFSLPMGYMGRLVHATLREVTWGDELPAIPDWPIPARPELGRTDSAFFFGDTDDAFTTGVTFAQGYRELLNKSESARSLYATHCAIGGAVYWGGGSRWGVEGMNEVLGSNDAIAFQLWLSDGENGGQWEIRHHRDLGVIGDRLAPPHFSDVEDKGTEWVMPCSMRPTAGILGPMEAVRNAWRMDLASGVPCRIQFAPKWFVSASGQSLASGMALVTHLSNQATNDPWDQTVPIWFISQDAEDGRLAQVSLLAEDLAALDAGALQEREIPTEQKNPLGANGYRCVPPDYTEFP